MASIATGVKGCRGTWLIRNGSDKKEEFLEGKRSSFQERATVFREHS